MPYDFLIDTYETERVKVVSVWSEFTDEDLPVRPHQRDPRGRSVHEQMVHQCVSEYLWASGKPFTERPASGWTHGNLEQRSQHFRLRRPISV